MKGQNTLGINIQNLTKSYGSNSALKGLSLTFENKGVVGLLGPNGAGKTTLMKILTGYLSRWEGSVQIGNMDLRKALKKAQKQIGYLPENNPLYPEMYVKEYLNRPSPGPARTIREAAAFKLPCCATRIEFVTSPETHFSIIPPSHPPASRAPSST